MADEDAAVAQAIRNPVVAAAAFGRGELQELAQRVAGELDCRARYVVNQRGDRKWHRTASCGIGIPAGEWRTPCGWSFASGGVWTLSYTQPDDSMSRCEKCFPPEAEDA